ncbi:unnamed protein product [Prunus armeniaca]
MKHLPPKKSKNVAFKVVNEEDDGHSNEDCSDEELTILTRRFMNFLKNQDPRSRDSKGRNSKNRFVNYTDGGSKFCRLNERKNPREKVKCFECEGYGHISSECANTLKKQKDGNNKAMHTTWSDSESECENDEKTVALITTVSLDESREDDDFKGINIEFIMNKYDDLLAASQKLSKQNSELVKEVAVLKLENCRIANEFQSPDADSEKVSAGMNEKLMFLQKKLTDQNKLIASLTSDNKALELELKNSKERIVSLTIGAEKIDKMISMGRRDGDKRGLGFEPSNKSSAVSKTKFVKSTSPIEPSASHEVKKFIPICHFCGTRGHIRPRCNKLRNEFVRSNSHGMGGKYFPRGASSPSCLQSSDVSTLIDHPSHGSCRKLDKFVSLVCCRVFVPDMLCFTCVQDSKGAPRPWWRFFSGELEAIVASIAFNIRSVEDHPVTEVELRRSRILNWPIHPPLGILSHPAGIITVNYRWMYPIERLLGELKKSVRNRAKPEGSIVEAWVQYESLTFCGMYLKDVETVFNRPQRNHDGAHWFVLNNCDEIMGYLYEHEEMMKREHPSHLVNKLKSSNSPTYSDELYNLAFGPIRAELFSGCNVNGVKFLGEARDDKLCTQNSGVHVPGGGKSTDIDFYGKLTTIVQLLYKD